MNQLTRDSVVTVVRDHLASDLAGETVILDARAGVYFSLHAVGSRVWELIQQPVRVGDILTTLLDEYEVDEARCERDLLSLLETLKREGLIEVRNAAPAEMAST